VEVPLSNPNHYYIVGAPPDTGEPLPLVLAFHGDEGSPYMSTYYIWGTWWEQNGLPFIAVMTKCPECTSWYQGDTDFNADYVWEVLADVASKHNVDVSRIYAVGYSGGSEFLSMHGWEFQDVFAGIQFTCGGNAYYPYTAPSREDCKVAGRVVISQDDFLHDSAMQLLQRLMDEGHPNEYIDAQCSGHCCDTVDHNQGAWEWFQTRTKCSGIVPGECGELSDLPPVAWQPPAGSRLRVDAPPASGSPRLAVPMTPQDFDAARDELDEVLIELEVATSFAPADRKALFSRAMAAYDAMLAAAHRRGPDARDELTARYPRLRALMADLRGPQ
jgi:hypothetical protein